jgi:Zn-finger nucleic acid-binding protein
MFCPSCQNTLRERRRDEVMLDICPGCGGVWLDRGELEKLTTSERAYYRDGAGDGWDRGRRYEVRPEDRRVYDGPCDRQSSPPARKRGGFLESIFGNFGEGD